MATRQDAIFLPGELLTGKEVRNENVGAAVSLANIVKTTLGPSGLDKMMVDEIGEITVTNDGATILQKLDVVHPAAKVLVELSNLQDREVGDGTTSVVIVAAEFLREANELIGKNMHATTVITGYQLALKKALNFIEKRMRVETSGLTRQDLLAVAQTSMSSKIIGLASEHFANLVVDAVLNVKHVTESGETKYPVKSVGIVKVHGGSAKESALIPGYLLNMQRATTLMPPRVEGAKIALLDFSLQQQRLAVGTQILITDASKLEGVRQMEHDVTKERIQKVLEAGANVIFTTGGIDDMAQKYLVEAKVFGVRRVPLDDLRRIAKVTGGQIVSTMADLEGAESFDPASLGTAEVVIEERLADDEMIFIRGGAGRAAGSIVLRGPNLQMIDEVSRSIHDSLSAVSRTLESGAVVAGGGCVEAALSVYLEEYSKTLPGKEQLAIQAFAHALLAIPRQLAVNSALDAAELVSQLRSVHAKAQSKATPQEEKDDFRYYGLDLQKGGIRNNLRAGVLEPVISKIKSLSFAVEAAVTILRIDDSIVLTPEQQGQQT